MDVKILDHNTSREQFNVLALHPLQSWEWGEARKQMGIEVLRIGEFDAKRLKNVYQVTSHQIPYTNYKICYLPRSNVPSEETLKFLYDYGKKHNVVFIKIEPYVLKKTLHVTRYTLRKSPHPLFPQWTQILDLVKSENDLLAAMHHKTRYNIKLAQKKGVVVKEMSNEEGFDIFSRLYFETCRRQRYFGHDLPYHRIVWNNLKDTISHILIAFYKGTPLAAYELFFFNKTLYYPYGGTSLEYRNLMASNLLMWEAVKLGRRLGAAKFDMWGSLQPHYDENHSWTGFTKFKEGYGGEFIQMIGSYDLIISRGLYSLYSLLYRLRNIYLRI